MGKTYTEPTTSVDYNIKVMPIDNKTWREAGENDTDFYSCEECGLGFNVKVSKL